MTNENNNTGATMPAINIEDVKIGSRIRSNDGFSRRYGTVYGLIQTRWGKHLRVKMDDFTFTAVPSLTTVGIGHYLVGDEPERRPF